MKDTSEDIQKIQRDIMFQKTMKERFNIGAEAINMGRTIAISNIRKTKPQISEPELKVALLKRYYERFYNREEFDLIIHSLIAYATKNSSNP